MYNLIDRDALKRDVRDVVFAVADTPLSNDAMSKLVFQMGELLAKKIDDAPGVDAEPVRHGQWIHDINNLYGCSECMARETISHRNMKNYCPWCGAKMEGEMR